MIPALNLSAKNIPEAKQMALMRQYINDLKNDMESELFDIKWENLSKPLQEKLNGYDAEIAAANDLALEVNANTVTTQYLQANYITAAQIEAAYVSTTVLETQYLTASYINTLNITARYVSSQWVYAGGINANQITAGKIAAARLDVDTIVGLFVAGNTAVFGRLNVSMLSSTSTGLRLYAGGTYADVYLQSTSTPNHYQLVVDLPT